MKSAYQNKKFSEYWDKRAGDKGEVYKRYVLDPVMFKLLGPLTNKTVFELGCGNGYLAKKFIKKGVKNLTLSDLSKHNLEFAKEKFQDKKIEYLEHDATKKWDVKSNTIDVVYSNMMLNEVENIKTPIRESYRVLKNKGVFMFPVVHPAFDLYHYAQKKAGLDKKKYKNLGDYFKRGYAKFMMGHKSKHTPELANEYKLKFEVHHFQRPLADYYNTLVEAGFIVKKMVEPEITKVLLKNSPRFKDYQDRPVGLIFYCTK